MCNIVIIPGLCCTERALSPLKRALKSSLGTEFVISSIDKKACRRDSTKSYLKSIKEQLPSDPDLMLLGHNVGGQFANLLAAEGFVKNVILLSTSLPSEWAQVDPLRIWLFRQQLISNRSFKFSRKDARNYILQGASEAGFEDIYQSFYEEEASFIREYAMRKQDTFIGEKGFQMIRENCKGFAITGINDPVCDPLKQRELSERLGFMQFFFNSGHSPHLDKNASPVADLMAALIRSIKENRMLPLSSLSLRFLLDKSAA